MKHSKNSNYVGIVVPVWDVPRAPKGILKEDEHFWLPSQQALLTNQ